MNKRYLLNWTLWIAIASAIYVFLYAISPLGKYGVVYGTFVALPIYFTAGAKKEEFWHYSASFVIGVVWALLYLKCMEFLMTNGVGSAVTQTIVVGGLTFICVAIHFVITPKTLVNKIPAMFGAIATTFSTGGEKPVPIMITLVLGVLLGLVCQLGTKFLTSDGHWQFSKSPNKASNS
jgi:hypothetical protein